MPLIYDKAIYEQLRDADIDHLLAQHIAHLFIRDSVSLFSEKVNQDDEQDTDHFEVFHLLLTWYCKFKTCSGIIVCVSIIMLMCCKYFHICENLLV